MLARHAGRRRLSDVRRPAAECRLGRGRRDRGAGRLEGARTGPTLSSAAPARRRCRSRRPSSRCTPSRVTAANRNDEVKLSGAFAKLIDEDPALQVEHDRETHQTLLWGQGEIHLRVALDRLQEQVQCRGRAPHRRARPTARPSARAPRPRPAQEAVAAATASSATSRSRSARWRAARASSSRTRSWAARCRASSSRRSRPAPASICSAGRWASPWSTSASRLYDGQFHSVDSNELVVQAGDRARAQGGPAAVRAGAARADPERRPSPCLPTTPRRRCSWSSGKRGQILGYEAKRGLERLGRDHGPDSAGRDARPDRHAALAQPGHGLLRMALRPPPGGAGPAGAGDRRQAPRTRGIAAGTARPTHRAVLGEEQLPTNVRSARSRFAGLGLWVRRPAVLRAAIAVALLPTAADPGLPVRAAAGDDPDAGAAGPGRGPDQGLAAARATSRPSCRRP